MTLRELIDHFSNLYGRRNRVFLSNLRDRIDFLNLAIADLQDAIRKEHTHHYCTALARVVSRIFCITEYFRTLFLVEALVAKYPSKGCSYCSSAPCACPEKRPEPLIVFRKSDSGPMEWGLRGWSEHLYLLYGERNRQRGIENLLNRLFKEVTEFLSIIMKIPRLNLSLQKIELELSLELADTLAWTLAIANFLNVDAESAVMERYGLHCWKCQTLPCACTQFSMEPVRWKQQPKEEH